jgi:hypothetical protein
VQDISTEEIYMACSTNKYINIEKAFNIIKHINFIIKTDVQH